MSPPARIVFVDNSISKIYKTIAALRSVFPDLQVFSQETELYEYLDNDQADIILISLDLQPNDGLAVLKELRSQNIQPPPYIIIYSEKQDDFLQELAYNSGADGFINFHQKGTIMALFLKNMMRRKKSQTAEKKEVTIDTEKYLIYKKGEPIQLPRKEFRLFQLLYNNPEKFISKGEIAELIWRDQSIAKKRNIDVHIYNIRQYFGKRAIQSQKGKGYRINKKLLG